MRLRICRRLQGSIDGVALDHFQIGLIYEIGTQIASVLLAEGWAEPVLLLTGADGADRHAATLEAVGAIEKPVDPDRLLNAVRTALTRQHWRTQHPS
jgi:DNA-binding response OmpR family regulator